ncbi:MAG: MFS transporter [Gammaproteobacteria bacterium]
MSIPYWRLSGFYFFYFAILGVHLPYWGLYLKDSGFDPIEIGNLSALLVATRIIAPALWGGVADRTRNKLFIIRITLFWGAWVFAGFLFAKDYRWVVLLTFGFGFFWNAALPLFEAITLACLTNEPYRYSRIRLWGSVGFITMVLGVGRVLDQLSVAVLPLVITVLLAANWLVTLTLPKTHAPGTGTAPIGILDILRQKGVLAFLLVSMLLQMAHGPYYVFYSIYLKQFEYSATLTGFLWALGVFSEILLFLYIRPVLAKFSLKNILLASLLLAAGRWLLIGWYAGNPYVLVTAQLLHAASFGSAHIASIHLIDQYFGQAHQAKGQALYSSFSFGLGGMAGSMYSGYFWELLGPEFVYSMAAFLCYLAFIITYYRLDRGKFKKIPH